VSRSNEWSYTPLPQ